MSRTLRGIGVSPGVACAPALLVRWDFPEVPDRAVRPRCRRQPGLRAGTQTTAGGDTPDPAVNPKFAHKLAFLDEMRACAALRCDSNRMILVGDLNVAPLEHDVWSHKQMLRVVSHTPLECEKLVAVQNAGGWIDAMRMHTPEPAKLYTWWSYRSPDWQTADKGRRLDHIWVAPALADRLTGMRVLKHSRGWLRPSDHVPVTATLDV